MAGESSSASPDRNS